MQRMSFYNKDKNNQTLSTLANALNNRKQININAGGINGGASGGNNDNQGDNTLEGAVKFGKGLYNLYNQGKQKGWFDFGSSSEPSTFSLSDYTSAGGNGGFGAMDNLSFTGSGGGIDNLSFMGSSGAGAGGVDNLSFASMGSDVASSAGSSGGGGWGGFGSFGGGSGGGGTPWGLIGKTAKTGYNFISDKDDSEYSDLEQSTIYPLQGASVGAQFGPWGAAGGAAYGLGYSFKDDIGLKDNDWLTTVLFPIGMGDEHQGLIQV